MNLTALFFFVLIFFSFSQRQDLHGSLTIRNYTSSEYNGQTQIFSITQDARGVMYFGNKAGVIEYDGTTWRTIKVINETEESREVNWLATDKNGRVYVAAKGDLGYLEVDKTGEMVFKSIVHLFKKEPDLKSPKSIQITDQGVFFHYAEFIYQFANYSIKTWNSTEDDLFYGLFQADGKIYVTKEKTGLYWIDGSKLIPAVKGKNYGKSNRIFAITNFSNKTFIQTSEGQIDDYTNPAQILKVQLAVTRPTYNAINVFDQYYSQGSFSDGLLIYDKNFNLSYQIDLSTGLVDGNVNCQFLDREGNIWIGTNKGISKIDVISPISRFGVNYGMISGVEGISNFKGKTYFASLSGVYVLNDNYKKTDERIIKVPGVEIDCYGLKAMAFGKDTVLLIAANDGVWMLKNHNQSLIKVSSCGPYNFIQSPINVNDVFVANYDGLSQIKWNGNSFTDEGYVEGFSEDIFNITVQQDGTLWLGTIADGIIKTHVKFLNSSTKAQKVKIGKVEDGPAYITLIDGVPYVGNDNGLFKIVGNKLIPSDKYILPRKCGVHRIMKDGNGRVWAVLVFKNNKYEIGFFENDATHKWNSKDFQRHSMDIVHGLFFDNKNRTWLGGPNGVMLFNPEIKKNYSPGFNALIRSVSVGDKPLFKGAFQTNGKNASLIQQKQNLPEIQYTSKGISFEYAASSYFDETGTVYSYKLEGQDEEWSSWSKKTEKSYTNLYEGDYTFQIKAKNIYSEVSKIASYHFVILPPWYRTFWAYALYVLGIIFFLFTVIKLSNRRIQLQKEHLEKVVQERTAEVVEQKVEIENQKELVEEKNRDIMDSIRYAKRLQNAILPTDDYIKSCFSDSFVYFQPKDIVSGDFYWFRKIGSNVYFAVVDCTGHGVPGAFVSIVGNNGLNRAIKEFGLEKPSEILDQLTILVEKAFKQEGVAEVRDGMDMSLCCFNLETNVLEYAGANNPLYIISNGELVETKGNKQPIGHFADRVSFTNHEIQLTSGDIIVLFTDGFADQFGGPKGKKYKYAQLKDFLTENAGITMHELGQELSKEFEEWKGNLEQIDDVCLLGIRV